MTLQDFAANETSTLIHQLLTNRSDVLLERLRTVQDAIGELERAAAAPLELDQAVQELSARLNQAFGAVADRIQKESRAAIAEVERDLDAERAARTRVEESLSSLEGRIARLQAELATSQDRAGALAGDLEAARDEVRAAEAARGEAESTARIESDARAAAEEELRDVRASLDASIGRIAELGCERDAAHGENQALKDRLAEAQERADNAMARKQEYEVRLERQTRELRSSLDEALADVAQLGAQLEGAIAEKGRLSIDLSAARGELQMAQAQRDAVAAQLKASLARAQMLDGHQANAVPAAPAPTPAPAAVAAPAAGGEAALTSTIEASVRSVEELTRTSSLADLLSGLANQLSKEFSRVALFRVHGNRLQGEHQVGFDYTTEVRKIAIPLNVDSLLTRVVTTREMERLTSERLADDANGAPFRGKPTVALALPIVLRGETIAVAYLDNWEQSASVARGDVGEQSILFARLVVRQSGVLFVGLAHEMRVLAELRDYAAALLTGAEQMYAADLETNTKPEALRARLEDNLACARQLFANRAAHEGPAAAALLDEQLEALIEADPSAPFARDLASIRVREHEARSAEAC